MIIFTHYTLISVVIIEDQKQLKSTMLSKKDLSQQFAAQIIMSLFAQLLWLDHSSIMLTKQHHIFLNIFKIESTLFYNDQLTNVTTIQLQHYSLNQKIKNFLREKHSMKDNIMMLDIKNEIKLIKSSWCNLVNASVVIITVQKLLEIFESTYLAIISSYKTQQDIYCLALHWLQIQIKDKNLWAIQNKIIDLF